MDVRGLKCGKTAEKRYSEQAIKWPSEAKKKREENRNSGHSFGRSAAGNYVIMLTGYAVRDERKCATIPND